MSTGGLKKFLEQGRWRPYQLGALASLPFAAAMLLAWVGSELFVIFWFILFPFWAGLGIFRSTPIRKMVAIAIYLGTILSFIIIVSRLGS